MLKSLFFSQRHLWIFFDLRHVRAVLKYCLGRSRYKYKFIFCCLAGQGGGGRNNGSLLGFSFTTLSVPLTHKGLSLFTKTWLVGFCFHICAYTFLIWLRLYTFHFLCCYGGFLLSKNKENKSVVFEVIIIVLLGEQRGSSHYRAT